MDSEAEFDRKTRAMFERAKERFHEIGFRFVVRITERLVEDTPGSENQNPADTLYQPKGRLRGGYVYSTTQVEEASRWDGGPLSVYGRETVQRLEADMRAAGPKSFFIVNEVAYAWIVREGKGRHVKARDFLKCANLSNQKNALDEALASMGSAL